MAVPDPPATLRVDGDRVGLSLSVEGAGPDILFVHGLGSARSMWAPLVAGLRARWRCWCLDLRGHGDSDRAPGAYSADDYAADVGTALDRIARPTIGVGHSLGGSSLVGAATAGHPHLRALYALDARLFPTPDGRSGAHRAFEAQLAMLREFQPERRPLDDYVARLGAAPYVGGGTNAEAMTPDQLRARADGLAHLDPECLEVTLAGARAEPVAPEVAIPIRVIAADPDLGASFRPEWHDRLRALSPRAEIETMTGVGHQLLMIRGYDERVAADLGTWLDRIGPPATDGAG